MKTSRSNTYGFNTQTGFALIEVLVSMIILAIGIIALLSTQIRSVAGVREAEGQTVIANAAQNLIEGMTANPVVAAAAASATQWNTKSYENYETGVIRAGAAACESAIAVGDDWGKAALSERQLCQFQQTLLDGLPDANVEFRICRDDSGNALEVSRASSGAVVWPNCNGRGDTLIQVAWQAPLENEGGAANIPFYTYQARVTD